MRGQGKGKEYLDEFITKEKNTWMKFITKGNSLKIASNGDINMFQSGSATYTALDYFYRLNKGLEIDHIDAHEAQWSDKCTSRH